MGTTRSDSFDESSFNSLSEIEDEIVERKYNRVRQEAKCDSNINDVFLIANDTSRLTEYFAVVLIQDRWRQFIRRETDRQHSEKDIYNSRDIPDRIILQKPQELYFGRTHSAATLIQVKWNNFLARKDLEVYRAKQAEKKLKYMMVRCES